MAIRRAIAAELVGLKAHTHPPLRVAWPACGPRGVAVASTVSRSRDLVLLKTAKGLIDADVSSRRALAALAKLKETVGALDGKELTSMRIFAEGDSVVVRADDGLWDVETGQGRFAFANPDAGKVRKLDDAGPWRVGFHGPFR